MKGQRILPVLLGMLIVCSSVTWAQGPRGRGGQGPGGKPSAAGAPHHRGPGGGGLRHALQELGQPLTEDQQNQIRTILEQNRPSGPPEELQDLRAARQAYEQAILDNQLGVAQQQAQVIASIMSQTMQDRLTRQAQIQTGILGILTADQVSALLNRFGTSGLYRLLPGGGPGSGPRARGHHRAPPAPPAQ